MDVLMIKKAQKGNKDSFAQIILGVKDDAYRIAYCYLHNEEDSMDAVCDAVEKAFVNLHRLKEPKFFKTWFIRIVINECKQQLRKRKEVISLADELFLPETNNTSKHEEKLDLEGLLKELPHSDRLLIYFKFYLGFTLEEIADVMEIPLGTVKSKIYGNLRKMKNRLELREV